MLGGSGQSAQARAAACDTIWCSPLSVSSGSNRTSRSAQTWPGTVETDGYGEESASMQVMSRGPRCGCRGFGAPRSSTSKSARASTALMPFRRQRRVRGSPSDLDGELRPATSADHEALPARLGDQGARRPQLVESVDECRALNEFLAQAGHE
jgi:hypothetical protein